MIRNILLQTKSQIQLLLLLKMIWTAMEFSHIRPKQFHFLKFFNSIEKIKLNVSCFKQPHRALNAIKLSFIPNTQYSPSL